MANWSKAVMTDKKAIIYCRVSDKKQKHDGDGLHSQEHRCRDYAVARGYVIEAVFNDDVFWRRRLYEVLEGYASGRFQLQAEVKRFLQAQPAFPKTRDGIVRNQEVTRLLTRPVYAGYVEAPAWSVSLRKGHHEPLISFETFKTIQNRIADTDVPSIVTAYEKRIRDLEERRIVLAERIANCGRATRLR